MAEFWRDGGQDRAREREREKQGEGSKIDK